MAGTITSLGIASGIDSNSIVSQLVALEKAPLTQLQAVATQDKAQITAFGQVQSEFAGLATTANAMVDPTAWQAKTASSSNSSVATISANTSASAGTYVLNVNSLAQGQSVTSGAVPTGSTVGSGSLTFQLGTWTQANPTAVPPTQASFVNNGAAVTVKITASDTIASIAQKINQANAGVSATSFNDGTSDRLLLTSKNTGVANGFKITAADSSGNPLTDGTGVSALAFDPPQANDTSSGNYGIAAAGNPIQYGANASATINGIAVTSPSNTLSTNISGITINLLGTTVSGTGASQTSNPVTLSVTQDLTGVVANISAFVTAYNTLVTDLTNQTAYDPATQTAALFQGDGSVVGLESLLSSMVGSVSNGSTDYQRLSDVGLRVQTDGTLSIDTAALSAAANNGTQLQALFTTNSGNASTDGFALKFGNFASGALAAGGLVATKAQALQDQLTQNTTDQQNVLTKAAQFQTRLQAQYTALDTKMASLNALNSYVSEQITTWNKSTTST